MKGCAADSPTEKEKKPIKIAPETQKLNWYVDARPAFATNLVHRRWASLPPAASPQWSPMASNKADSFAV